MKEKVAWSDDILGTKEEEKEQWEKRPYCGECEHFKPRKDNSGWGICSTNGSMLLVRDTDLCMRNGWVSAYRPPAKKPDWPSLWD